MGWYQYWLARRRQPALRRGRPEDVWLDLIRRVVPGRSFVDVGCMWRVHGAYSFHALECGASRVTGIDINPATEEFQRRNREQRVEFVQADLNDPLLPARAGEFDVVFCSGVLYHMPNLLHSLDQLRRLCRGQLILTTASITERETPNAAVFLPSMDPRARAALDFEGPYRKPGLDSDVCPERGYANWIWLPTASCVRAMVSFAGFTIEECIEHRRVTTVLARATEIPTRWGPVPPRATAATVPGARTSAAP